MGEHASSWYACNSGGFCKEIHVDAAQSEDLISDSQNKVFSQNCNRADK